MEIVREIITRGVIIQLRKDGIVTCDIRPGYDQRQTLNDVKEVLEGIIEISGGELRPILGYIHGTITKEARDYFSKADRHSLKNALIARGPVERVVASLFLGFSKSKSPTKVFTDEDKAIRWLLE